MALAAALLAVIGAASLGYGILELIATGGSRAAIGSGAGIILIAYAIGLFVVARGVLRGRRWSRAPAIASQLIQLPVVASLWGGPMTWFALVLGAVSVTIVVCLLLPGSTRAFVGGQLASDQ